MKHARKRHLVACMLVWLAQWEMALGQVPVAGTPGTPPIDPLLARSLTSVYPRDSPAQRPGAAQAARCGNTVTVPREASCRLVASGQPQRGVSARSQRNAR